MREITDKEFFELSKTDSVKVFDFWAPWCGPCKMTMAPSGDLFALGFSTKGRNRGVGLNNVKELLDKYNNIILETEMEGSTFRQIIRFKREFEWKF